MALRKHSAAEAAKLRALGRAGAAIALGLAPIQPAPECRPLDFGDRAAATLHVSTEPVYCAESVETYDADAFRAHIPDDGEYGNAGNDRAAMRYQLMGVYYAGREGQRELVGHGPHESGGNAARVAVLLKDGRQFILEGSWSAIRRALPDAATLKSWKEAGATEFPLWTFDASEGLHRLSWVPIDQVPAIAQMEYESRGLRRGEA